MISKSENNIDDKRKRATKDSEKKRSRIHSIDETEDKKKSDFPAMGN